MIISIFRGRLWHKERVTQIHHGTRQLLGTAPSEDCSPHAGSWEAIPFFSLSHSHPLHSLAASSCEEPGIKSGCLSPRALC